MFEHLKFEEYIDKQASKYSGYYKFVLCKYEKTGKYHIFPAKVVNEVEVGDKVLSTCGRDGDTACCGKSFNNTKQLSKCLTRKQVRTLCADMANKGEKICAVCIATFY
jgi:hypothetical protein